MISQFFRSRIISDLILISLFKTFKQRFSLVNLISLVFTLNLPTDTESNAFSIFNQNWNFRLKVIKSDSFTPKFNLLLSVSILKVYQLWKLSIKEFDKRKYCNLFRSALEHLMLIGVKKLLKKVDQSRNNFSCGRK